MDVNEIVLLRKELLLLNKKEPNDFFLLNVDSLFVANCKKQTVNDFKESVKKLTQLKQLMKDDMSSIWETAFHSQVKDSIARLKKIGEN